MSNDECRISNDEVRNDRPETEDRRPKEWTGACLPAKAGPNTGRVSKTYIKKTHNQSIKGLGITIKRWEIKNN